MERDVIAGFDEQHPGSRLLQPVMRGGRVLAEGALTLEQSRADSLARLQRLPEPLRALTPAPTPYPVEISQGLHESPRRAKLPAASSSVVAA
jgi:hypothetical protein